MAWLVKNEAKAVISATTKTTAAKTMALAVATEERRGTEASVVRIEPLAYSEVTMSAPRTPTTNCEMKIPPWEIRTGSKLARSLSGRLTHREASSDEISAERPMPAMTMMASEIHVDRTLRNLVHSEAMSWRTPARPWSRAAAVVGKGP